MASGVEGANAEAVEARAPRTSADTNFILLLVCVLSIIWCDICMMVDGRIGVDFSNKIMIKIKSKSTSLFEKICLRHVTNYYQRTEQTDT